MYSFADEMLLGDMPLGSASNAEKYVDDAANEIDSVIGQLYETPVDMSESGPVARHSRLLLQRIANHLASGRFIMAQAVGGEGTRLHAYGRNLVVGAERALAQLASGDLVLVGAPRVAVITDDSDAPPRILSGDETSGVEAFYANVMNNRPGFPVAPWEPGVSRWP
jgi:hypothetical protein